MEEALKYFQSYGQYFWQWETDEEVQKDGLADAYNIFSIPHVSVIAYRTYALELLRAISDDGIPPLGSFLLVLYASGNYKFSNFDGLNYYLKRTEHSYGGSTDRQAVLKILENISLLPKKLKSGKNKVLLLQVLFHNCHHAVTPAKSKQILAGIEYFQVLEACAQPKPFNEKVYSRDLHTLQLLAQKFPDTDSIVNAMQGMPVEPEPADEIVAEEAVPAEKDFIEQLIEETKTFQVGTLIRRIWSGLKIPMQHLSPGEQPIGGISDMTNKGNIDRMLLSEFAYDDETFIQRIANNEALYIQREIPPETNIFERVILIDISLKNWGTPRVMAYATALAIASHPKAKDECRIFLVGNTFREMDYGNVEGVIGALSLVSPVLDFSAGVTSFFETHAVSQKMEVFILSAEDNFRSAAMHKLVSTYRDQVKFLVSLELNGTIRFFKLQQGTKKLLQTIILPLEDLWKQRPKTTSPVRHIEEGSDVFPVLFTATPNEIAGFVLEGEYYFLSRKKNLYSTYLAPQDAAKGYYAVYRGWEPVVRNISIRPKGAFALGKNDERDLLLCHYDRNAGLLSLLNLTTRAYTGGRHQLPDPGNCQLLFIEDTFFVINRESRYCRVVKLNNEELQLEQAALSGKLLTAFDLQQQEVNKARGYRRDVLSNHHAVGVTNDSFLQFSKHKLMLRHSQLHLVNNRPQSYAAVAVRDGNSFRFEDGSIVLVDPEGMITLRSAAGSIPDIFIPSCIEQPIAAATEKEFAGAAYYLPQAHQLSIVTVEQFYEKYIEAFIQQIISYADTA